MRLAWRVSDETDRFHLQAYKLSKWGPHTLLEADKQQRMSACFSLLSRHCNAAIVDRVLITDERCVLYTSQRLVVITGPCVYTHTHHHALFLVNKSTLSSYQRVKLSLRVCIRSSWNVCNRIESEVTRAYCSSMTMQCLMWRGWSGYRTLCWLRENMLSNLHWRPCAKRLRLFPFHR